MHTKKTIFTDTRFYDENSERFYDYSSNADVSAEYSKFLQHIAPNAHILDAGCGVGRDIQYFCKQGYRVTGFDGSEAMVVMARTDADLTGIKDVNIFHLRFADMCFENQFDAVWAQASLLHVPYHETREIYEKLHRALKPQGIVYMSYKYGDSEMTQGDRTFYNMNEEKILPYLDGLFEVLEMWRPVQCANGQQWLSVIAQKIRCHAYLS